MDSPPASLTNVQGVYLLADDAVMDWVIPMLVSLQRWAPALPVMWIPFGGSDRLLRDWLRRRAVEEFPDEAILRAWDRIGCELFPTNVVGARLFRKMAAFDGPFETFAFIDCDTIVRGPLEWLFDGLEASRADVVFYDEDLAAVYGERELRAGMVDRYASRGWNTGVFAGRRGAISIEQANGVMAQARVVQHGFAPTGEQPFFNYLLDVERLRVGSFSESVPTLRTDSVLARRGCSIRAFPIVHWAGQSQPSILMPHARFWLRQRLAAGELRLLITWGARQVGGPARRIVRRMFVRAVSR